MKRSLIRGADPQLALTIAERFAVAPRFVSVLARAKVWDELPADVAARAREICEQTHAANAALLADLVSIAEALDAERLPYAATKGSAILVAHHSFVGERHLDDIDLLVRATDLPRVDTLLTDLGATTERSPVNVDLHPLTVRTALGTKVEVHVRLPRGDQAGVLDRATPTEWRTRRVRAESSKDLINHLCHHVIAQHIEDPRPLPRHLVDVAHLKSTCEPEMFDPRVPEVRLSLELLALIERFQDDDRIEKLFASWLFPTHHSLIPSGIASRRGAAEQGSRVRPPNWTRVRSGLVFRVAEF
ncbi:MAG: nucleotidyltransferase family protein [Deltaproteobacteria bacterium]|nr:nucleotidyltransferase family protein [Deltaproteobacteria bacterium]